MFFDNPHRYLIFCLLLQVFFSEAPSNSVHSLRVTDLVSQCHVFRFIHLISSECCLFPFVTKRIAMSLTLAVNFVQNSADTAQLSWHGHLIF
jgi:hypothetical protein